MSLRYVIKQSIAPSLAETELPAIVSPDQVVHFWHSVVASDTDFEAEKERLVVLVMSTKSKVRAYHIVSVGTVNETCAHPREILRPVIMLAGYSMILTHNHPSGDPSPSQADRRLTSLIREAADIFQIVLQDHVIIGRDGLHYSFREAGLL
jgi:DNA repair protein RadC